MRLDIYRRAEYGDVFSYLAVPEGHVLPDEVTNTDWDMDSQAVEFDEKADLLPLYDIEYPLEQISTKGYAITNLKNILN